MKFTNYCRKPMNLTSQEVRRFFLGSNSSDLIRESRTVAGILKQKSKFPLSLSRKSIERYNSSD